MKEIIAIFSVLGLFIHSAACADDCLAYKLDPKIEVSVPIWTKEVVRPLRPMDLWHGNVVATFSEDYEIEVDTTSIEDGFCISLKSVRAMVGYNDFMVQIDSRHAMDSCAYNAILMHEDEHIRAYLSVVDDYRDKIKKAVHAAANSETPIFVKSADEINAAMDAFNRSLRANPELVLINQKIQAEQEIRNKRVDQIETGAHLKQCIN